MASPTIPYQTCRLLGLPLSLKRYDLVSLVSSGWVGRVVATLAKSDDGHSQCAVVSFEVGKRPQRNIMGYLQGLQWQEIFKDSNTPDPKIDFSFYGLTPLNDVSSDVEDVVEVIAVTGIGGKPFASWQSSAAPENMWLRDYLPRDISGVRVQIYGYESTLSGSQSTAGLLDYTKKFRQTVWSQARHAGRKRIPMILIGHSLGCLMIKQALVLGLEDEQSRSFLRSVYSIVFFGAPHRGMQTEELLYLLKDEAPERLISDLRPGSSLLERLNEGFKEILKTVKIVACAELKKTPTAIRDEEGKWKREGPAKIMVSKDSACLYAVAEETISIDENHSMIAKLSDQDWSDYWRLKDILKGHVRAALRIVHRRFLATEGAESLKSTVAFAEFVLPYVLKKPSLNYHERDDDPTSAPASSLSQAIPLMSRFRAVLENNTLVQMIWGADTPASSITAFYDSLTELHKLYSPYKPLIKDLDVAHHPFLGTKLDDLLYITHIIERTKHFLGIMWRSLSFSILSHDNRAFEALVATTSTKSILLDVVPLRRAMIPRSLQLNDSNPALTGSLKHVRDIKGTHAKIMQYTIPGVRDRESDKPRSFMVLVEYRTTEGDLAVLPDHLAYISDESKGQITTLTTLLKLSNIENNRSLAYIDDLDAAFGTFNYLGHMRVVNMDALNPLSPFDPVDPVVATDPGVSPKPDDPWALIFKTPKLPRNAGIDRIITLQRLLDKELADKEYSSSLDLRARFDLAHRCCLHLLAFHSCGWIHKDLRSSNILLVPKRIKRHPLASVPSLQSEAYMKAIDFQPYITGFSLARPITGVSAGIPTTDPEVNLYRHPARQGQPTEIFTKIHDIYALGAVLFEIGTCRNIPYRFRNLLQGLREGQGFPSPSEIRDLLIKWSAEELPKIMGFDYTKAVIRCLTSDFGIENDNEEETELGMAFQRLVVEPIERGSHL